MIHAWMAGFVEVRGLNSKGSYSRKLKGGDAHVAH
jgi:hypothetical protein